MSLTAALKRGLSVANADGGPGEDWDPYPEAAGGKADKAPVPKAAVVRSGAAQRKQASLRAIDGTKAARSGALEQGFEDEVATARSGKSAGRPAAAGRRDGPLPVRRPANQAGRGGGVDTRARGDARIDARGDVRAERADGKAAWLDAPGVPVGRVNPAQYARELDRFAADEARRAVADTLMDVRSTEIEGVARLAARIKARYLAKLLDVGNPAKSGVQETEIKELMRYRETYEELGRGLDMLKSAIESGDVTVSGMIRR